MITESNEFSLKQAVITVKHKADPDGLYVEDLIATFGARSHGLLIIFFSTPFLQPIPLLGLSTPLGLIIAVLGLLLALEKKPWLPQKLLRKHLSSKLILSCCNFLIRLLTKSEKFIKPRYGNFTALRIVTILNGLLITIYALLLSLPLPIPFSNSVPAYFLVFNAIGWLEKDGLILIISYLIALAGFVFFAGVGIGSVELIQSFNLGRFF